MPLGLEIDEDDNDDAVLEATNPVVEGVSMTATGASEVVGVERALLLFTLLLLFLALVK